MQIQSLFNQYYTLVNINKLHRRETKNKSSPLRGAAT